jgi:hypothetical protein
MPPLGGSRNPRGGIWQALIVGTLAAHVFFPILWLVLVIKFGPLQNDWWQFRVAAEQFVSGDWDSLYTQDVDSTHPGYFWRYPPFALYFVTPLAWLSPGAAYAILAVTVIAALGTGLVLLARTVAIPFRSRWAMAIVLSAPAVTTLITGQLSALLLLVVVAACVLGSRGRPLAAAAMLGLLAIKPNVGAFFGLFLLVRGEWRAATTMASVAVALVAITIPLGASLWVDFWHASGANSAVLLQYPSYKLITLQGFLSGLSSGPGSMRLAVWAAAVLLLLGIAGAAWRRPAPPLRHLGHVVLLAVAANPYLSFYDGLLLAVPATAWWSERALWRPRRWWTVGICIAAAWLWEHASHTWAPGFQMVGMEFLPPFSIVGPAAAVWLVVGSLESLRISRVAAGTERTGEGELEQREELEAGERDVKPLMRTIHRWRARH